MFTKKAPSTPLAYISILDSMNWNSDTKKNFHESKLGERKTHVRKARAPQTPTVQ